MKKNPTRKKLSKKKMAQLRESQKFANEFLMALGKTMDESPLLQEMRLRTPNKGEKKQ